MQRTLIFGNSGAGKSTLAKRMAENHNLAHFDLDTIAWQNTTPPQRMPLETSLKELEAFLNKHNSWVIEGCYTDLLEAIAPKATDAIFLDISIEQCINNAKNRPFEPHKYATKEAQDANLEMLITWIKDYTTRTDTFSYTAHAKFFKGFSGKKQRIRTNIETNTFGKNIHI